MNTVLLCPGQGAQHVGMGRDLAERFPRARAVFDEADAALGFPLSRVMWNGPEDELTLTHNAQPAILAHTLAAYAVVQRAMTPVAAAGHSLGEYSAYVAAGGLALDDAVRLVRRRGELMLKAGRERPGTMAAVIGLDVQQVAAVCKEASTDGAVVVAANMNAPDQTVISGDPEGVSRAAELLAAGGAKRVLPLKVSGAFHSPLMAPAERGLQVELERVAISNPSFPVIANASAEPVTDAAAARRLLGEQLTAPVRWAESMQRAVRDAGEAEFVEIGPGTVLSGLLRRIVRGRHVHGLGNADELAEFLERYG